MTDFFVPSIGLNKPKYKRPKYFASWETSEAERRDTEIKIETEIEIRDRMEKV